MMITLFVMGGKTGCPIILSFLFEVKMLVICHFLLQVYLLVYVGSSSLLLLTNAFGAH